MRQQFSSKIYPETRAVEFAFAALEKFGPDAAMRGEKAMEMPRITALILEYVGENEHSEGGMATATSLPALLEDFKVFLSCQVEEVPNA